MRRQLYLFVFEAGLWWLAQDICVIIQGIVGEASTWTRRVGCQLYLFVFDERLLELAQDCNGVIGQPGFSGGSRYLRLLGKGSGLLRGHFLMSPSKMNI